MILRRLTENLRAQNWTAITIEFLIVVLGVFIGIQAANWNQARLERRATEQLLTELKPALRSFIDFFETAELYYATTSRYAKTAFAGWRGDPAVSDEQFVISAYQASQIYVFGLNGTSWSAIFGSDQLRNIDDPLIRRELAALMFQDYQGIEGEMFTDYREHVRQVVPEDIQDAIRARCGDRPYPNRPLTLYLPAECDLPFPAARFAAAASDLRARRELAGELRWHQAAAAGFRFNMEVIEGLTRNVLSRIEASER